MVSEPTDTHMCMRVDYTDCLPPTGFGSNVGFFRKIHFYGPFKTDWWSIKKSTYAYNSVPPCR